MSSPQQGPADELSRAKRALIEKRLRGELSAPRIRPRPLREGPVPASFAQKRLWLLEQLQPGNTAYNMLRVWNISDPLDQVALEAAIREVVRRHQSLRTRFETVDDQPVQIVEAEASIAVKVHDSSDLSDDAFFAQA